MAPIKTKQITVVFDNGVVRRFDASVYKSESHTYGNQYSLVLTNKDNDYADMYDIRYDTRIRRDLSNFDSYIKEFITGEYYGVTSVS